MCRNITELRGLDPPATSIEIEAAAMQFVRKVTGMSRPTGANLTELQGAAKAIAAVTEGLLTRLPPRRQPPRTVPPLRLPHVRDRLLQKEKG